MEKTSFDYLWELVNPSPSFNNVRENCRALWNARSVEWQRRMYWFLREQKRRGEPFKANPYYVLNDTEPRPTNWNGRQGINDMMKTEKMVSAYYPESGKYGIYTLQEAELFEMKEIRALN